MSKVESAVVWALGIAYDNSHGYDQTHRWGNDYDCSSLVISAFEQAGIPVKTKGATYTGNMYSVFTKCGFTDVTKNVNLKTGTGLLRGDVLLVHNSKHQHTGIYCGGMKEVEASINENGKPTGGKTGDQTGKEILVRSYRTDLWTTVLRYKESITKDIDVVALEVIQGKWGNGDLRKNMLEMAGYNYEEVQAKVNKLAGK